jgi:stage V sporulation protein B
MGQIITSLLQALGKAFVPVKVLSVCVALKIILNLALLPAMGITGAAIASVACFGIYALCNYLYLNNLIGKSTAMVKNGSKITLCGAIMSTTVFVMNSFLKKSWAIWPSLLSSAVVYALTLLAIGFFDENELKSLPLSAVWIKINKVFRRIRNAIT